MKFERITKEFDINKKDIINIEVLARKAGLYDIYAQHYRMFSDEAHSSYTTLQGYLLIDRENNLITGIRHRNIDNSHNINNTLIAFLGKAIGYYTMYMQLGNIEIPEEIEKEFKKAWII